MDMYVGADVLSRGVLSHSEQYKHLCLIHENCLPGSHVERHVHPSRDIMVERNMRMVLTVAQRFMSPKNQWFADVIAAGTVGLIYGIDKFDVRKRTPAGTPYKFSTYAVWWISSLIRDEIARFTNKVIRQPAKQDQLSRLQKELKLILERDPEVEEIVQYATSTSRWQASLTRILLAEQAQHTVILDEAVDKIVPELNICDRLAKHEDEDRLKTALNELSVNEVYVLMRRYMSGHTLNQIAVDFAVSKEWVRQVEADAVMKLRAILDQGEDRPDFD